MHIFCQQSTTFDFISHNYSEKLGSINCTITQFISTYQLTTWIRCYIHITQRKKLKL